MISYLGQVVNFVAVTFQNFLVFTSFTGQIIVLCISSVTKLVITAILNIFLFFQIVYEDNVGIFTEDIPCLAIELIDNVTYQWNQILDAVVAFFNELTFKYYALVGTIKWSVNCVLIICGEVLLLLKTMLILIGESLWLVLTFVPVHLPYVFKTFLNIVGDIIVYNIIEVYKSLLKFTNFLSDVPLESFIGILLAILIVRLSIYYRVIVQSQFINIYWILVRKMLYLYYVLYNYFTNSEVQMIARIASGHQITTSDLDLADVHDTANPGDALCVICQERQKCVLTLPCRHICLCTECCVRLYGYQRTCPICRTFIYHSVTVYL